MILSVNGEARTVLYSAWFCPFAQRAWCALNELGVPYERVEALQVDPETESYIKDEGLLKANPKGLVPTVVQKQANGKEVVVCDSMEILKDVYDSKEQQQKEENGHKNNVQQLYEEAMEWNKLLCSSAFYSVLMKQVPEERAAAWNDLKHGLELFSEHLYSTREGPDGISYYKSAYATGKMPSLVDFCVFPFIHRLYLIEHYTELRLPRTTEREKEVASKIYSWTEKMEALPSVKETVANPKDLIPIYLRYADGTAKSKVGDSIRQGKHVHDV